MIIQPNCLRNVQLEAIIRNSEIQQVHVQAVPQDIIVQQDSRFTQTSVQPGISAHYLQTDRSALLEPIQNKKVILWRVIAETAQKDIFVLLGHHHLIPVQLEHINQMKDSRTVSIVQLESHAQPSV